MHSSTTARPRNNNQWKILLGRPLHQPCELFADHRAHTTHDESRIGDTNRNRSSTHPSLPGDRRVNEPRPFLLRNQSIRVGFFIFERQWIAGTEIRIPLLECALVKHLLDALPRREIKVVTTFGTDTHPFFSFFAENGT